LALASALLLAVYCAPAHGEPAAIDPLNSVVTIEGTAIALTGGRSALPMAPGSAAVLRTQVLGTAATGDLDGDGDEDAVLWLVQETGGSGTFHFLAATMREPEEFVGTTAVFLGDRLRRTGLLIDKRVVVASLLTRHDREPMASAPSVPERRFFTTTESGLREAGSTTDPTAMLLHGMLVIGHETRSLQPCGEAAARWLAGDAETLRETTLAYQAALPNAAPYTPVFATMLGRPIPPVEEGFGADYEAAFEVRAVLGAWPDGSC
jgi:hypothetical protein